MNNAKVLLWIIVLLPVAVFTGCKSTDFVQLSPDTYMLTVEDHAGIFGGSAASLESRTIREADAFAASKGKIAIPVDMKQNPVGGFRQWPSCQYQFEVLDTNDPAAQRTSLTPRADIVVEKTDKIAADIRTREDANRKPDLYTELTKLDDLRKRGIITDEEFASQKQKLLNQTK